MAAKQRYRWAAGFNVLGNAAKLGVEGVLGFLYGSTALLADAADSLMDLLTSCIALFVGSYAYDEKDIDHPHGHERFEPLAAFIVGIVMVGAGTRIGIYAVNRFLEASIPSRFGLLLVGAAAAIAIKAGLYWYNRIEARRLGSTSLHALATDALNDVFKSIGVAAGIGAAMIGLPRLEAAVGVAISLVVVYNGVAVLRENTNYLVGSAPKPGKVEQIRERLLDDPAVRGVHDLVVHHLGTAYEVEVHVEVDGSMSLREAHDIETRLYNKLNRMEKIVDAHIHMDPVPEEDQSQ